MELMSVSNLISWACRRGIADGKMGSLYDSAADCPETLGLDDNAISAIEQWRFQPAAKDGVAVPIRLNIEVNFNLK